MRSLLFFLFFPFYGYAQINNLVANPSFEEYYGCPDNTAQIDSCINWFQPLLQSSTEYFNACCTIPALMSGVGVPSNQKGFQYAHTGDAYAGFGAYGHGIVREYLEGTLSEPLKPDRNYCVEFYYTLSEYVSPFFSSQLGVFFSQDSILSNSILSIQVTPQVSDLVLNDSINWIKISGFFTAGGGEKYLLIGNFEGFFTQQGGVYTYIDDVSVYLCDDTIPKPKELKIPNVFTPDNDELNDQFTIENLPEGATVQVYNRWGVLVAEWNNPNGSWDGRMKGGAEASAGVYYCIVKLPDGERKSSFVHLIK